MVQSRDKLPVLEFFKLFGKTLRMTLHSGEDLCDALLCEVGLHRPGLALAGYTAVYSAHHIQIIGHTEWNFLESLGPEGREKAFSKFSEFRAPMWVVTHGQVPHKELIEMCEKNRIPLFSSSLYTFEFLFRAKNILEKCFAPYTKVHATLMDIYGIGMLYIGDSNVGKSECALDLVERGHRLVADDAVQLMQVGEAIIGQADPVVAHCMEIRGIGIIDVRSMFGIHAVRKLKKVEVIIELKDSDTVGLDRTGLSEKTETIMGVPIPRITIPVSPGKNLAVISEVIAMNILMKASGENSSQEFDKRLQKKIQMKLAGASKENIWNDFFDMDLSPYE